MKTVLRTRDLQQYLNEDALTEVKCNVILAVTFLRSREKEVAA